MSFPVAYDFSVRWSDEDDQWVATAPAAWPFLSWLADTPVEALTGLVKVIDESEADILATGS